MIGEEAKPVRAIWFDKSEAVNWALDWHQDRTVCVEEPREAPGFGPWTTKAGILHVAPPYEILKRMVTLRVHIDHVPEQNGPLLISPGSHQLGKIAEPEITPIVTRCGTYTCLAEAGDIWAYSTPILHASKVSEKAARRRVLQLDYAAFDLPSGLTWKNLI